MTDEPPVSFSEKAKQAKQGGGYPVQISGSDLDKNFVFATLQAEEGWIEQETGKNGHTARKLALPALPSSGTHVLGCVDGTLEWLETEDCE